MASRRGRRGVAVVAAEVWPMAVPLTVAWSTLAVGRAADETVVVKGVVEELVAIVEIPMRPMKVVACTPKTM